ncbi:unnamed protein product [Callosobruchus maculatus]|uniref:Uncharacterized protein n=1 Tax=Callosobruchus maculatus TaxID=64391 RepID=A0A653BMR2_CALMS|nr:unnamed protein product [Callosobruchus maculatus]
MNEQIFEDTRDILELVDDRKEKVANAKQRLKQEEVNNENLIVAKKELETLHALNVAGLATNEYFIDKTKSTITTFVNEAREVYSKCQELHPCSSNQADMLDGAFNTLTKKEANFAQAQNNIDELLKSLEEEYKNLCYLEEETKERLKNGAIISEEQKIQDLLANIQKAEQEGNDLEIEYQTLQLNFAQNLKNREELEAKLLAKKEQINETNAEVKYLTEYCDAEENVIKKLEQEIAALEEKMTEIQAEINSLTESISSLSEQPQEDLDELIMVKQQSLEAARKDKAEKKQKYKELFEKNQGILNLAKQQCSDFEAAISEFKQKIEISETHVTELKAEEEMLMKENELSLATLKKYEQEVISEKYKLKKLKAEKARPLFTKPNIPKPTPIGKPELVVASSKRNPTPSNWDSDGSMDADYNAFIQKTRSLKRLKK